MSSVGCLDENVLEAHFQGQLSSEQALAVRQHIDGCPDCLELSAALARSYAVGETFDSPAHLDLANPNGPDMAALLDGPPRLERGMKLGRYVVENVIGSGGMGVVYTARDPALARKVALKVVTATGKDAASMRKRLLREGRTAAQLQHVNIVSVFDVGQVEDTTYVAMELIAGQSLRAYIGDASVPMDQRVAWLIDVACALRAAHQQGVVHRDIKPENVMVRPDGTIKVVDFGISRQVGLIPSGWEQTMPHSMVTKEDAVVGTPMYMAPEQLRNEPPNERSDQFAWGVMAYELLTGKTPWKERGLALISEILSAPTPPLIAIQGGALPSAMEAVVQKTLSKSASDRFASIGELIAALSSRTAITVVPPPAPAPNPSRWRWFASLGAAAVLGTIAIAWLVPRPSTPATTFAPTVQPSVTLPASTATPPIVADSASAVSVVARPPIDPTPPLAVSPPTVRPPIRKVPSPPVSVTTTASAPQVASGKAAPPLPSASPNRCNPPFTWVSGVKVPKPDCPLD